MDEMRVKLTSKFMRNIVSKLIVKYIYKKFGCKVNVTLNELDIWTIDGDTNVKLNIEAKLDSNEFNRIMRSIDID